MRNGMDCLQNDYRLRSLHFLFTQYGGKQTRYFHRSFDYLTCFLKMDVQYVQVMFIQRYFVNPSEIISDDPCDDCGEAKKIGIPQLLGFCLELNYFVSYVGKLLFDMCANPT